MVETRNFGHVDDSPAQLVEKAFHKLGLDEFLERRGLAVVVWSDQASSSWLVAVAIDLVSQPLINES